MPNEMRIAWSPPQCKENCLSQAGRGLPEFYLTEGRKRAEPKEDRVLCADALLWTMWCTSLWHSSSRPLPASLTPSAPVALTTLAFTWAAVN